MNELLIDRLRNARLDKKLKQQDVAEILGLKPNTISNWENGRTEPDIDSLVKLCDIYDLDCSSVLSNAYSYKRVKSEITLEEFDIIKIIRSLDLYGRNFIDLILKREFERVKKYGALKEPEKKESESIEALSEEDMEALRAMRDYMCMQHEEKEKEKKDIG